MTAPDADGGRRDSVEPRAHWHGKALVTAMHRYTTWKAAIVGLLAVLVAAAPLGLGAVPSASAANGSDFRPGMIISDAVFYDGNAMSAGEVQAFLNSKVARCSGANGQPCLKDYRQNTQATPLSSNR